LDFQPIYKSRGFFLNRYKELGKSGNCPIQPDHGDRTVHIIITIIINMAKVLVLEPVPLTLQVHNILTKLR
jgi:hypothetical protein